jgi:hypothetical protein
MYKYIYVCMYVYTSSHRWVGKSDPNGDDMHVWQVMCC